MISKGSCSSVQQFPNSGLSGERVSQDPNTACFGPSTTLLLFLSKGKSILCSLYVQCEFNLCCSIICISFPLNGKMTHHTTSISVQCFSKCIENSQIWKNMIYVSIQHSTTLNLARESLTVNFYYHSDINKDFKV